MQSSLFEPGHPWPCPSYNRCRDRIDLVLCRSLYGGRGGTSLPPWPCRLWDPQPMQWLDHSLQFGCSCTTSFTLFSCVGAPSSVQGIRCPGGGTVPRHTPGTNEPLSVPCGSRGHLGHPQVWDRFAVSLTSPTPLAPAIVGVASVNFRTVDFGGAFFNWSYCGGVPCAVRALCTRCARAVRKVGCSPPPGVR